MNPVNKILYGEEIKEDEYGRYVDGAILKCPKCGNQNVTDYLDRNDKRLLGGRICKKCGFKQSFKN